MIEKCYPDKYTAICDICYENLEEYFTYDEALKALKAEGWKCRKGKNGYWQHICCECQKEGESE